MHFPAQKLPKNHIGSRSNMHRLVFLFMFLTVINAQSTPRSSRGDAVTNFQPSLPVVVGVLAVMFTLTFILLFVAKYCHRQSPLQNQQNQGRLARSRSRYSGIDKTVIESLPFFKFSALKGSREGLECSVCLSKFQDIEILRLLPTCRHAFHIACVDQWLERHSTCPLCRHKVSSEDLALITYSDSLRMLMSQSDLRQDSNLELFVQREEDNNYHGSSRFSRESSLKNSILDEEVQIQDSCDKNEDYEEVLHKLNHKIIVSDVVLKNRWSSLSTSDLLFLNSEMINEVSSNRFQSKEVNYEHFASVKDGHEYLKIKEGMERKKLLEKNHGKNRQSDKISFTGVPGKTLDLNEKRSMSEIIVHPRFLGSITRDEPSGSGSNITEERRRKLWLPIASRTVEWFASRERGSAQSQNTRKFQNI